MLIETITYLATFVTSTGIALVGSLVSYQFFREKKEPALQILLYHQIFMFSFFIHAIWGNLAIRQVIADMDPGTALAEKLSFFIPLTGLPFLVAGWFMLLKFGFNLNGYADSKKWIYAYFCIFLLLAITFAFLFQNHFILIPGNPDTFLIRLFIIVNLFFHMIFSWPFLKPADSRSFETPSRTGAKWLLIYWPGVMSYSVLLWFSDILGYISTNLSFLALFAVSGLLPVCLKYTEGISEKGKSLPGRNFHSFCTDFEISKREAEVILEICSGKTNKAIAEKLFISLQTVKDHTHRIYTKTQVKSRVQLANLVREKTGMNL